MKDRVVSFGRSKSGGRWSRRSRRDEEGSETRRLVWLRSTKESCPAKRRRCGDRDSDTDGSYLKGQSDNYLLNV